jgi:hypothetical protein
MADITIGFLVGLLVLTTVDIFIIWLLSKKYILKRKEKSCQKH